MPNIDVNADIEPSEFIYACSKSDIKELIEILVEDEHLPASVLTKNNPQSKGSYSRLQNEFTEKMGKLIDNYHSISTEDEEILNEILKKYI